jgi:GMP synthase (glutamine-hydrolysing)
LGLSAFLVNRQPFPGPGLAVRIVGEVTEEKLEVLRVADAILREEVDGMKRRPDQYFAVLTDTCSVGVKGDDRTYHPVIAIRAVTTGDFMTCEYAALPHKILSRIASRITSEIPSVSRVVYDITSKPPATVELE